MILDLNRLGLTQRVATYHLFFSIVAVGATAIGMIFSHHWQQISSQDQRHLSLLNRSTSELKIDFIRNHGSSVQSIVDRISRQSDLLYCAVVSGEGNYLAHSDRKLVGKRAHEPTGTFQNLGSVTEIHYRDDTSGTVKELRTEVAAGSLSGDIRIGSCEKSLVNSLLNFNGTMLLFLLPMTAVALGAMVIRQVTTPLTEVETQLIEAAKATLQRPDVNIVSLNSATALGWNRIVDYLQRPQHGLGDRLEDVIGVRQSDYWETIVNAVSDGLAVTDDTGRIVQTNRSFSSLVGSHDEESEMDHRTLMGLLDDEAIQQLITRQHGRSVAAELSVGDHEIHIERSRQLTQPPAEGLFVWTARDITQQKMSDRMHAQFVDSATHELRTPLSNIKAYAETLALTEEVDVEQQKEFCNIISTEATRLARFIDDLLDVRSLEVGSLTVDRQNVEVSRLFDEVVDKVKPLMDSKRIRFIVEKPDRLPELSFDKDKIFGVLVNLLGNAVKYTLEEGQVDMQVCVEDGWFEVAVRDTGLGIADEELPRVFEKFFRSDDPRVRTEVGTGLGLALAKEVVELHDGTLTATSQLNEGSTFTMRIPTS